MQRAARQHKDMEQRMEILDLLAKAIDNRTDRIHRAAQDHQHNSEYLDVVQVYGVDPEEIWP